MNLNADSNFYQRFYSYQINRGNDCIACATCQAVCPEKVHRRRLGFNQMEKPESALCLGAECAQKPESCINQCPKHNLTILPNPKLEALGDFRWTPELLAAGYRMAETGKPAPETAECQRGLSDGGFDLLDFIFPETPSSIRPEEVDLSLELNRREGNKITIPIPWYGGGMSFGSISLGVMLSRVRAVKEIGTFTSTGEGGYPEQLFPYSANLITQVATGLFGVREDTIKPARVVEFKYAQGAKPGLGGHLLGDKVTPRVAELRQSVPWRSLFSPFPFHSVYSVEDHKKHLDWIKAINPEALLSVKVSTPSDVDMVAVGSYYAGANIVHLDGGYGGTGASPEIAKKNIAMPIEFAIGKTHKFLLAEGIRDQIVLMASGGIRSAHDILKAIALGADGVVLGTFDLVALECVRCRNCESQRGCPRGIATTDDKLERQIDPEWGYLRILNLYRALEQSIRIILARMGLKSIKELRGRTDLLAYPAKPLEQIR